MSKPSAAGFQAGASLHASEDCPPSIKRFGSQPSHRRCHAHAWLCCMGASFVLQRTHWRGGRSGGGARRQHSICHLISPGVHATCKQETQSHARHDVRRGVGGM